MAKTRTLFFCKECGAESPKWAGKCPSCGAWNTFVEERVEKGNNKAAVTELWSEEKTVSSKAKSIESIVAEEETRMLLPDMELNRTLGGGLVQGSIVLIAGEPGIGKSTLFLQCALQWKN